MLAANDNSKNQIYLGGSFTAANLLPFKNVRPDRTGNLPKTGRTIKPIYKAEINFGWINSSGNISPAPNSQLILYPQYAEVRFSGFLLGCKDAPSTLMRQRQQGRILIFGILENGDIIGYVDAHNSTIASELEKRQDLEEIGVFRILPLATRENSRNQLLKELGRIHQKKWINSKRLDSRGEVIIYNASNGGGYTLEAELGITPNGFAEPDYLGWEIKQHGVTNFESLAGRITLLTPEPNGGYYKDKGVDKFLLKYGAPDRLGREDRINFGGIHLTGVCCERTGLTMQLEGYSESEGIQDADGGICLVSKKGEIVARWSFTGLISHWNRKHALAAYVPAISRISGGTRQYWYGSSVRLCRETDVLLLLKAFHTGKVYYDPGIKMENVSTNPKIKRRNQFRIRSMDIPVLYKKTETADVIL